MHWEWLCWQYETYTPKQLAKFKRYYYAKFGEIICLVDPI